MVLDSTPIRARRKEALTIYIQESRDLMPDAGYWSFSFAFTLSLIIRRPRVELGSVANWQGDLGHVI